MTQPHDRPRGPISMSFSITDHPPEELLEVLILASEELGPDLHDAVTAHARRCGVCKSVLGLLLQFHRLVQREPGASHHADALMRAVFTDGRSGELRRPGGSSAP